MLELLHAPDAFAVRAGRLLESVCTDQKVPKRDGGKSLSLDKRINRLVDQAVVPEALAEQAHMVRNYRNVGGHDDDIEVEEADAPLVRDFVEALLDYLYRGPKKLADGHRRLEERRAEAKKPSD